MIIENGTIEYIIKTDGGIDRNTGYAIKPTYTYSSPVPCQIVPININYQSRVEDNRIIAAKYTILLEQQEVPSERIRVTYKGNKAIGEFSIISVRQLDAVCETEITI